MLAFQFYIEKEMSMKLENNVLRLIEKLREHGLIMEVFWNVLYPKMNLPEP